VSGCGSGAVGVVTSAPLTSQNSNVQLVLGATPGTLAAALAFP